MYIRPPKKRRSSPVRVLILLALVAAGSYILLYRRDVLEPLQIGPTPTPTPTADDVMADAHALYLEGDVDGAMDKYEQASALDPDDPDPYVWLSLLLTLRGRTAEGVERARQAVGVAPDSARARSHRTARIGGLGELAVRRRTQEAFGRVRRDVAGL